MCRSEAMRKLANRGPLSRTGLRAGCVDEATGAPMLGRTENAGAPCRPTAAGYVSWLSRSSSQRAMNAGKNRAMSLYRSLKTQRERCSGASRNSQSFGLKYQHGHTEEKRYVREAGRYDEPNESPCIIKFSIKPYSTQSRSRVTPGAGPACRVVLYLSIYLSGRSALWLVGVRAPHRAGGRRQA